MLNSRWRHILRRTWFTTGGVLAVLAIALAVLMALGQLLLPLLAHYPDRVAQVISQRLHKPVSFASMQGYWQPSGPLLVLHHVEIGQRNGKPALVLPSAKVKLDFGALVMPSRHWVNLRLSGLKLTLRRDKQGLWHVAGFGVAGQGGSQHLALGDLPGNLWLDDLQLDIDDARTGHHYRVRAGPIRVSSGGGEVRFAGLLRRGASSQALKVAGRVGDGGRSGRLYLAAENTNLGTMFDGAAVDGYALDSGHGDVAAWLTWKNRRLTGVTAQVNLADLVVDSPVGKVKAPQLRGLVQMRRTADALRVLMAPGDKGAARVDVAGIGSADVRVVARAHDFDPGNWLSLGALAPQLPPALGRWLAAASPRVHLISADVDWSRKHGLHALDVRFDRLHLVAAGGRPGVDHVHGVLRGDENAVSLELPAQALTLHFPGMYSEPLAFSSVGGDVALWRGAQAWHIATGGITLKRKGFDGQLRGSVRMPVAGGAPTLQLFASVAHADVLVAEQLVPTRIMGPAAAEWLDHGLVAGTLDGARVVLRGNMADWPFAAHDGRFQAHVEISGLALDYQPGWPGATDISVAADFVGNRMLAEVSAGQVQGIKIKHAVASIPDLGKAELILNAQGAASGNAMMDFIRQTPIGTPHASVLDKFDLGGTGDFNFSMVVPLSRAAPDPFTLGGTVQLHEADLSAPDWKLQLDDLNGALVFNHKGFSTRGLTARFHGQPVTLHMAQGPLTGHADWPLEVHMRGRFSLAQLVAGREQLAALADMSSGSAAFDIGFHLDAKAANPMHAHQVLSVHSDLRGIKLDLPAPLTKPAYAVEPLEVQLGLPFAGGHLRVALGDRLHARVRLPADQQPAAVDVRLGAMAPSGPMPASGIRIRGRAEHLDVSGWVKRALSAVGGVGGKMPAIDVDVVAEHTHIFGQQFKVLRIKFHPTPTSLVLDVDGTDIKGNVTIPVHDMNKRGIVARFDRLYWPKVGKVVQGEKTPKAAPAAAKAPVLAAPTPQEAAAVGVAPSSLPPLHVWVGDLRFGDAHLGHARLETWPSSKGMHINMLRTQSKSLHMSASGDWNGTATNSHTHMEIDFSAANLGHMLDAFGYDGIFIGGQTRAHLDASWPGAPYSFSLANVEGTLSVKIGRGRIPKVKPGVGRLFGLMSIAELPRRLTMDFGSIFGKGFGFDSITGHFRFHDGNAYTKDFTVKGPSADIHVTGRFGFRAHDYDQHVLAIPHIGNSLPIVGAVVGGPVGAAAGFLVQGLLGNGLDKVASARYHITGSWGKPEITLVEKHVPAPAPAPASSASAPARASSISMPAPVSTAPASTAPAPAASSLPASAATKTAPMSVPASAASSL
ncbi:MAG TPA: YhdP family protein [Oleiagrimonas sp.]|nr:YhdP family protein [Oleiagrimonas sp.]